MVYILYKTTNLINGKFYIGKHKCVSEDFDGYLGSGTLLKKAILKHGKENFIRQTLAVFTSQQEVDFAEEELVSDSFLKENSEDCYNLARGGKGGFQVLNEEGVLVNISTLPAIRKKISEQGKLAQNRPDVRERKSTSQLGEKNHRFGENCSEKHKKQISDAHTGRIKSEAERKAISDGLVGHTVSEETRKKISEGNKGKTVSTETRAAMSAAKVGRVCSEEIREKISKAHEGMLYEERTCIHCLLKGRGPNMTRYHFDNCKHKPKEPERIEEENKCHT